MNTTASLERTLTQADFDRFAALSGDDNPIHVDAGFARRTRFGRPVAHGMLIAAILDGLCAQLLPDTVAVDQALKFEAPTYAGEPMRFTAEIVARDERGASVALHCIRIADGVVTCSGATTLSHGGSRDA